jgi:hypothetical protein
VTDWIDWHAAYDEPGSDLTERLGVVQRLLDEAVASRDGERLRVLSICAGDGRDVLPVLARWRLRKEISGRLIEAHPALAAQARAVADRDGLDGVEVVCGDAAEPASYVGAIPADLIVVCGVFGNVSDNDVRRLIAALPRMCAARADVVWTRHRRPPDATPRIRDWFEANGFEERAFSSPGPNRFAVGRHELTHPAHDAELRGPLFTFVR